MTQARTAAASPASPSVHPDPQKIIVPRKHGQVLIEPPLPVLQQALDNSPAPTFHDESLFADQPLKKLRHDARQHLLNAATVWASRTSAPPPPADALDKPWILTGHQLEFYHAGVWAKVLAANALARNSIAFDLLVDHDIIDHCGFDIPSLRENNWTRTPIHWASPSSIPADGLHAPTLPLFEKWDADLAAHPQSHTDSLAFFLAALKPPAHETLPYAQWLSQARSRFERALDVHVHHVPASLVCAGDVWHLFVRAWIEHADAWTSIYNQHLAAYRLREGIKNPQHPMPDLTRTADTFELPFWIYNIGQPRQRLIIRHTPSGITILHNAAEIQLRSVLTAESDLVIRPRALALTMFLRLFLADLFIHGIGGALYDQITDGILSQLFGIVPSYACVSAAWLLPLGRPLEDADDIAALKSQRHHLAHNPQLMLDPFTARKPDVAEQIDERRSLIEQIRNSISTSRRNPDARRQRAHWFHQLHTLNETLHHHAPRGLLNLDQQLKNALLAREQNKVLLSREYFFPLHSMESLQKLITTLTPT